MYRISIQEAIWVCCAEQQSYVQNVGFAASARITRATALLSIDVVTLVRCHHCRRMSSIPHWLQLLQPPNTTVIIWI